jgi:hypothetical protein
MCTQKTPGQCVILGIRKAYKCTFVSGKLDSTRAAPALARAAAYWSYSAADTKEPSVKARGAVKPVGSCACAGAAAAAGAAPLPSVAVQI